MSNHTSKNWGLPWGEAKGNGTSKSRPAPFVSQVIQQVLQTRAAILASQPAETRDRCVFLTFWDFDGTLVHGDCSEGLSAHGKVAYPGLAQVMIERGLSAIYPQEGGFEKFWRDYTTMSTRHGQWIAYPYIPQMLEGAKADEVLEMSRTHFAEVISKYLVSSSVQIMRTFESRGIESHVLSASAGLFVKGASATLGVPEERIHGIEVRVRDGRLTEELVLPVTWSFGKLDKMREIVAEQERGAGGRSVFVLAGFGDSYRGDGPFLKQIATQELPAGKPLAVFFDSAGEPPEYRGLFYHVSRGERDGSQRRREGSGSLDGGDGKVQDLGGLP
jgi:phosphoserine phosphatase